MGPEVKTGNVKNTGTIKCNACTQKMYSLLINLAVNMDF